jgi:hypothetical protein
MIELEDGFLFNYKELGYNFEVSGLDTGDITLSLLIDDKSVPFNYNRESKLVEIVDLNSAIVKAYEYLTSIDKDNLDNTLRALLKC